MFPVIVPPARTICPPVQLTAAPSALLMFPLSTTLENNPKLPLSLTLTIEPSAVTAASVNAPLTVRLPPSFVSNDRELFSPDTLNISPVKESVSLAMEISPTAQMEIFLPDTVTVDDKAIGLETSITVADDSAVASSAASIAS